MRTRRPVKIAAAVSALAVLVGCGGQEADDGSSRPPASSADSSPSPASTVAEESGNQNAQFGDVVTVTNEAGVEQLQFTVTNIETRKSCPGREGETYPMRADSFLIADMTVTTTDELDQDLGDHWSPDDDVSIVGSDGVTDTNAGSTWQSAQCYPESQLPFDGLRPGMKYQTKMALETDEESGTLIVRLAGQRHGFAWRF